MADPIPGVETRADRWARLTDWPLMGIAVLFLVAYAVPIIDLDLGRRLTAAARVVVWVTWAAIAVDYVVRVVLARNRVRYVLHHWLDLLIIALPLLRPLRLLRLIALLSFIRRRAGTELRGRIAIYVAGGTVLLAFCAALAELDAERSNPDANITTFGTAIWWAATTMTTMSYGDYYPTTAVGKVVAIALMIGGLALLGSVTATFASWVIEHATEAEKAETTALEAQIAELRQLIVQLGDRSAEPTSGSDPNQLA